MLALMQKARLQLVFTVLFALVLGATVWWTASASWDSELADLRSDAQQSLNLQAQSLHGYLSRYEALPRLIATSDTVIDALAMPFSTQAVNSANSYLVQLNAISGALDTYIMNAEGTTIAASNWDNDKSFVGRSFAFRPYFQQAMQGVLGRYYALGTTSGQRGYYFSYPVTVGGERLGAVVVKAGLEEIETIWRDSGDTVFATDPDGIVFVSGDRDWRFKAMHPISDKTRFRLLETRRYAGRDVPPLRLNVEEHLDGSGSLVELGPPDQKRISEPDALPAGSYLLESTPLHTLSWTLHVLRNLAPVRRDVRNTAALAGSIVAVIYLMIVFLIQYTTAETQRAAFEQREREALQRARDELEARVRERTADLIRINERLEDEVAEHRRTEKNLHRTQDDLVQAAKMAALGQLAAGLAHEMNQPLAAMRSYADNARVFLERDRAEAAKSNLELIGELTERMAGIIGHLRVFGRKTPLEIEPVPVIEAVESAVSLLRSGRSVGNADIRIQAPGEGIFGLAERVRLEQVLMNLLRNALDATEGQQERTIDVSITPGALQVAIAVRDNGPGIPPDRMDKLFDPFFTTKEVGQGMGLGLSISYSIAKDFGGTLEAHNPANGGAEFILRLKRAKAEETAIHG